MGTVIYTRDYQLDELLGEDSPTSTVVLKRSYTYNALEQQGSPHPHQHDAVWLPFGATHLITGTASNNARFPGQWFQLESDLHYNWHRHYDPTTGR